MTNEHTAKASPRDVFLHLLIIVTLYTVVVSFIALMFQYIMLTFPDTLTYNQGSPDTIRWSSSALLVIFPVFLWLSTLMEKDFKATPLNRDIKIRKWLIYLTLFIAAITILVDLVRLVYNFYGGELTTPFVLKIIVVVLAATTVFGYYFWELHQGSKASKIRAIFAWGSSLMLLGSLVAGFFLAGSPAHQRQVRFDQQRIYDLQSLQGEILNHWTQKAKLPVALPDLANSISGFVPPADPETHTPYEYAVTGDHAFDLCATFKTKSRDSDPSREYSKPIPPAPYGSYGDNWDHGQGRTCFRRTIDPQLYKPQP